MWRLIWDVRLILNIITIGWYEMLRLISNTKLDDSGAVHDCIYTMTYEWVCMWTWKPLWWYTQSYDSVISIGGVWTLRAKDRLHYYGSSMYMVTVQGKYTIIWISIFIYIVHRYSVVHIITDSYKIYI
jgi:hypothetical protein